MLDRLTSNWALKVLAVGLAFSIWVSVTGENSIVQDFTPPLDILLPDNYTLASDAPTTVTVRLRGSETSIRMMDELLLGVQVDLRDGALGERDISLTERNLTGVPRSVEMDFITPDRLNLVVDRRVRLRLPVEPTFIGSLPEGYFFYGAEVRPKKLVVEGPETELSSLESVATTPLRLDDLTRPVNMRAVAVPQGPYTRIADAEPLQVRVIVDATPIERTFEAIPIQILGTSSTVETTPSVVNATLTGPPYLIETLLDERLVAVADVTDLAAGIDHTVEVRIDYLDVPIEERARINADVITPKTITVRITEDTTDEEETQE